MAIRKIDRVKASESAGTEESVDLLELLTRKDDPATINRRATEDIFLQEFIFKDLVQLKPLFDSPQIAHFTPENFLRVVERCMKLGVRIIGVEIFTTEADFLAVEFPEDMNSKVWFVTLLDAYRDRGDLSICATYGVPEKVLGAPPNPAS